MRYGKSILLFIALFISFAATAQRVALSMPDHDDKKYYFGITFGLNYSVYQINYTEAFAATDTFKRIQPKWEPGFNLGLLANLKITNFIDLRFVPSLAFAEKRLDYNYGITSVGIKDSAVSKGVESIYMHLPLQVKFKSDRINNFRFYAIVGGKFDYDLAANARSRRSDEFLKVSPVDYGYEVGVGFEFFNESFIFSPEIKLSQGLRNQLYQDHSLPLTNAIQTLLTRDDCDIDSFGRIKGEIRGFKFQILKLCDAMPIRYLDVHSCDRQLTNRPLVETGNFDRL